MPHESPHIKILILERSDAATNMDRYYVLSIEQTLFGDVALRRQWGRRGTYGQTRLSLYRAQADAEEDLQLWFARKKRRGYRLCRS